MCNDGSGAFLRTHHVSPLCLTQHTGIMLWGSAGLICVKRVEQSLVQADMAWLALVTSFLIMTTLRGRHGLHFTEEELRLRAKVTCSGSHRQGWLEPKGGVAVPVRGPKPHLPLEQGEPGG